MPNDIAGEFAKCDRGLVVAPAGCGKTHLIADAVGYVDGRQLVLTHTHAGVAALKTKLLAAGVATSKYRVTTLDSLALCYVNAFPSLAGWRCAYPDSDEEWNALRLAVCRLFSCRAPRRVLRASYCGVFVDEYQDCCGSQHTMVETLAQVLPCRIVGDPLQAIYRKLHPDDAISWSCVERVFPPVHELTVPHRWRTRNAALGDWLSDVRSRLVKGGEVDFTNAYGVIRWVPTAEAQNQTAECYRAFQKERVVAICDWPSRCAGIAARTRNHFSVLASVECPDLLRAADEIQNSSGLDRVATVVEFAQKCLTGVTVLRDLLDKFRKGGKYNPRAPDKIQLWAGMERVSQSTDLKDVRAMLCAIDSLRGAHFFKRRELWREMLRTLRNYDASAGKSLREVAWTLRDRARMNGRRIGSTRTVATPLLIKGLEFDHALLLDAAQMTTAEELYVALTRGSTSLTVLSDERTVRLGLPVWIAEAFEAQTSNA